MEFLAEIDRGGASTLEFGLVNGQDFLVWVVFAHTPNTLGGVCANFPWKINEIHKIFLYLNVVWTMLNGMRECVGLECL